MKKAQQTIIGLILIAMMVIILSIFTPIIGNFVLQAAGNLTVMGFSDAAIVSRLIMLFMWIGLVITIFVYTQVTR